LLCNLEIYKFEYCTDLDEFIKGILNVFKNGVKILSNVDNVEKKVLKVLFKNDANTKLKFPKLDEMIDQSEGCNKNILKENQWIYNY